MTKPSRKILKQYARDMRNHATKGEKRLWCELLRGRAMHGYQFLRQYPIDYYIADFACRKLKLIIEVDGYSHNFKQKQDAKRTTYLNTLGYTVMRFTEKEVKNHIINVRRAIEGYIEEFEQNGELSYGAGQSPYPAGAGLPPFSKGDRDVSEM